MARLKASSRSALPSASFGLPATRKYPMPDKAHAANAKARASQQVAAGNLSKSSAAKIDAKANAVLQPKGSPMKKSLPAAFKANQFKAGSPKGAPSKASSGDLAKGKPSTAPKASNPIGAGNGSHIDNFNRMYGNGMNPGRAK